MSHPTPAGRFAPSPTGDLHLGNLRTALLAWLFARSTGRRFLIRIEDLDRVRAGSAAQQLKDLAAIGLTWDGEPVHQSTRSNMYDAVLATLTSAGLTYECYCSRREVVEAASAPQHTSGRAQPLNAYPGTCRHLSERVREAQRSAGKPAAIRLRANGTSFTVTDLLFGETTCVVDDFVLRRNDGTPAYNLAVVVDDAAQGVDQVVRGDDLLTSAPRHSYLARLLGYHQPTYAHVPLVLGPTGQRLAKRDGAVTLADLRALGWTPDRVLSLLAQSLGLVDPEESVIPAGLYDLVARFDPAALPRAPWVFDPATLA
ncbi:MAG: tRNA glutamyl-Q(34) synthetase GluQRS [Nakamurella sp.]